MIVSSTILAAFKTSKYGSQASNCADSFAISPDGMKIAIADGVSKSYMPKFVANALTEIYVSRKYSDCDLFKEENATELLSEVIERWKDKSRELESSVDEDTALDLADQRELYGMGASTFAGISLGPELFSFDVLGDSCIFIIPKDSNIAPLILSSMPCEVDSSDSHPFKCEFGTHPHFVDTNGRIVGEPLEDSVKACDCTILMATDAFSDWFCRNYSRDNATQIFDSLSSLKSQEEFDSFINELRDIGLKNDDVAIVLIEVRLIESETAESREEVVIVSEESLANIPSSTSDSKSEESVVSDVGKPQCEEYKGVDDTHQDNRTIPDISDNDNNILVSSIEEGDTEETEKAEESGFETENDNMLDNSENSSEDIEVALNHKVSILSKIKECLGLN